LSAHAVAGGPWHIRVGLSGHAQPEASHILIQCWDMADHAFLIMAANQTIADLHLERLQAAGVPVITKQPVFPYPSSCAPVEVWLTDARLLEDPEVKRRIESILHPPDSEALPIEEAPEPSDRKGSKGCLWALLVFAVLVVAWGAVYARPRSPSFEFMKGAKGLLLDDTQREYMDRYRVFGEYMAISKPFEQVVREAQIELERKGFTMERTKARVYFWREFEGRNYDDYEAVELYPGWKPGKDGGSYEDDPASTTAFWSYYPSLGERVGSLLGL
jgi:hypothetical protein